ncbi:MAG: hypothetical protein JWO03_2517 [Bacteroidetes bacterium]|nr:hypothetical protein [Bacteroidota bacterium]
MRKAIYIMSLIAMCAGVLSSCHNKPAMDAAVNADPIIIGDTSAMIDRYLTKIAQEKGFSGALLITKDGKKIFSKGYGYADQANKIPFNSSTLGSMGSITKAFTAAAIMKLYEQGKLSLTDSLLKFFPEAPADKRNVTIHQLLTHSSGFHEFTEDDGGDYQKIEKEAYMKKAFAEPLSFEPGTKAIYSNVSMSILGIIIEQVSGMDYEQFLKKELFEPAGIWHLGYQYPPDTGVVIAHGYESGKDWGTHLSHFKAAGGGPYWNLKANGGLEVSLNDMYLWTKALTDHTILKKSSVDKMFEAAIVEDGTDGRFYFGYGCNVEKSRRNTKVIDNGGSNNIYFARLLRLPEEGVIFYMVTNEQSVPTHKVGPNVTQLYFYGKIMQDAMVDQKFENPKSEKIYDLLVASGPVNFEANLKKAGIEIENDEVLLGAGRALVDDKKTDEAMALYLYYTKAFPHIVVAQNDLGDLYRDKGQKEEAIKCYKRALKIRPNNPRATEELKKLGAS